MKNKIKMIVAVLLLLSSLLTACAGNKEPIAVETKPKETTDAVISDTDGEEIEYLTLFADGKSNFDLITGSLRYAEDKDYLGNTKTETPPLPMTEQIAEFYMTLLKTVGAEAGNSAAPKILAEATGKADRIELHYGNNGSEAAKQVLEGVPLNEYGYFVKENKIFIYGHTMDELQKASAKFITDMKKYLLKDSDGSKTHRIPADAKFVATNGELAIMSVPKPTFGTNMLFCESGLAGERMWVVNGCTTEDYGNYINELKGASFTEYETNEIEGNLFATYTKDDIIVDAWYTKDGYVRINATKGYDSRPLTSATYQRVCEPALIMLGMAEDNGGGQECLIFRLSDGRFVIVDSAIPYDYSNNIMAALKKFAPDPNNIVVASWLFTHNHGDHVCGFIGLCRDISKYKSILTVESFTFNFPGAEQGNVPWQEVGVSSVPSLVSKNFPNAKIYRALPGNTLKFADMSIEILASPEFYIYENFPNNTNACNVYYRVTMGGQIINVPGDTSDFDHGKLVELYGDYLQCDILQAPHHGGDGSGTVEAAKKYAPKYILYCHSSGEGNLFGWDDHKNRPYNQQLIDPQKNPNYEEHFVMTDKIYYLPLPYTTGKYICYTWADFEM